MTEVKLYQQVRRMAPRVHFTRIENAVGMGMFDVNACFGGREFWIENKIDKGVAEPIVLLRSSQYAWSAVRHRVGGKVFVFSYSTRRGEVDIYCPPFHVEVTGREGLLKLKQRPECSGSFGKDFFDYFLKNLVGVDETHLTATAT